MARTAKKLAPDALPTAEWSMTQLGTYVERMLRRTAGDIWRLGKALEIVRENSEHGEWLEWCKTYAPHLSLSMIYRFRRIAKKFTLEEVEGKTPVEVYRLLGWVKDSPATARTPAVVEAPAGSVVDPQSPTTESPPNAIVEAPAASVIDPTPVEDMQAQDFETTANEDAHLARAGALAEKIVAEKPHVVRMVRMLLDELMTEIMAETGKVMSPEMALQKLLR